MSFQGSQNDGRSARFVSLSIIVHALAVAAVLAIPALQLLPSGNSPDGAVVDIITEDASTGGQAPKAEEVKVAATPEVSAPAPKAKPLKAPQVDQDKIAAIAEAAATFAKETTPQVEKTESRSESEEDVWTATAEEAAQEAVKEMMAEEELPPPSVMDASTKVENISVEKSEAPVETETISEEVEVIEDSTPVAPQKQEESNSVGAVTEAPAETPSTVAEGTGAAGAGGTAESPRSYLELRQSRGNRPPIYPVLARRNGWQGEVVLNYYVTSTGQVEKVSVSRSSGFELLDKEAVRAISQFRYVPGQAGWTSHPVLFNLKGLATPATSGLRSAGKSEQR